MNKSLFASKQVKSAIVYTISRVFVMGMGIITTPIFTRIMSTSEIGLFTIFNSWRDLLGTVVGLALTSGSFNIAMMQFEKDRKGYMSSALSLSTISAIFFFGIFLATKHFWLSFLNLPEPMLYFLFLCFVFFPAQDFLLLKYKYEYAYKKIAVLTLISSILSVILSVASVLLASSRSAFHLGEVRVYSSNVIGLLISFGIFVSILFNGKKFIDRKYWYFALTTSLPLIIHAVSKHIMDVSDRIMIGYFFGLSEVGIYGILYTVSSLSLIIWSSINASLIPYMFEKMKSDKDTHVLNGILDRIVLIYAVASVMLMLVAPEVVAILATEEYVAAVYLVPPVAAGIFFVSLYNIFSNALLFYKKSSFIMMATVTAALCNIVLNFIFIPMFGLIAAAYTTLASYVVLASMQYYFIRRTTRRHEIFHDKFLWRVAALIIIASVLINALYPFPVIRYLVLTTVLLIIFKYRNTLIAIFTSLKE